MPPAYFDQKQLLVLDDAVTLAEDMASDFFKLSLTDWKKAPYDVKTLKDLAEQELVSGIFAQVTRYSQDPLRSPSGLGRYEFYKICLHDHEILRAVENSKDVVLFPLLLYVMLHELVHIVRFKRFLHRYDASIQERATEEMRVHRTTSDILKAAPLNGIDSVLRNYENQTCCYFKEVNSYARI